MADEIRPEELPGLVDRMAATPAFKGAGRADIACILGQATRKIAKPNDKLLAHDGAPDRFLVLLEGEYRIERERSTSGIVIDVGRGSATLVGLTDVAHKPPSKHSLVLEAVTAGVYLDVPGQALRTAISGSPALRQVLWPMMQRPKVEATPNMGFDAAVVQFLTEIPDTPLSLLIELLGRRIAESFPDRILIVRPPGPGVPEKPERIPLPGPGSLFVVGATGDQVAGFCKRLDVDYVFLDGVPCDGVKIFVKLTLGRAEDSSVPVLGAPRVLETVVVSPAPPPCVRGLRLVGANRMNTHYMSACRLHVSFESLRPLASSWNWKAPTPPLEERLEESLAAWARALTQRRTGLTIAGGGVWSLAGIYVIRQLRTRYNVPIDVITGASGGSIVGGYYASHGLDGLDELVDQAESGSLNAMVYAAMVSGCFMQRYYERSLGHHCIEHLPHAEFYPAISNLSKGEGVVAVGGSLSLGIRASGSSPPLVAPTITGYRRLVDGAYTNNVPAQALSFFDTQATFAVNVYPPSRRGVPRWLPQGITRINSTLNPLSRFLDFVTAFNLVASISGRVEAEMADVRFNARSTFGKPYLIAMDFDFVDAILEGARTSVELNAAIAQFAALWETMSKRGAKALGADAHAPAELATVARS